MYAFLKCIRSLYVYVFAFLYLYLCMSVIISVIFDTLYVCFHFIFYIIVSRPLCRTYQHVGQVFDENDNVRLNDIDGFIRGVPVPGSCRKRADWIYG